MCICCRKNPTPRGRPYCPPCTIALREEIEDGLRRLAGYLAAWAAFQEWEASRQSVAV